MCASRNCCIFTRPFNGDWIALCHNILWFLDSEYFFIETITTLNVYENCDEICVKYLCMYHVNMFDKYLYVWIVFYFYRGGKARGNWNHAFSRREIIYLLSSMNTVCPFFFWQFSNSLASLSVEQEFCSSAKLTCSLLIFLSVNDYFNKLFETPIIPTLIWLVKYYRW